MSLITLIGLAALVGAFALSLSYGHPRFLVSMIAAIVSWLTAVKAEVMTRPEEIHLHGWKRLTMQEAIAFAGGSRMKEQTGSLITVPRRRYEFCGIELTPAETRENFGFVGGVGVGKSSLINRTMIQVIRNMGPGKNVRVMVYDHRNELLPFLTYYDPYGGVIITNPFHAKCKAWAIHEDIREPRHAETISQIWVPEDKGHNQFFTNAARLGIEGIMKSFIYTNFKREDKGEPVLPWTLRDVCNAMKDIQTLREILKIHSETAHLVTFFDREKEEVWSTVLTFITPLETIAALWHKQETFSFRKFRDRDDQGILLFGNDVESAGPMGMMTRFMMERYFQTITTDNAKKCRTEEKETWNFLDELGNLVKIEGLKNVITSGRPYGITNVCSFQNWAGFVKAVRGDRDLAGDLWSEMHHRFFGKGDYDHSEWCSRQLGTRMFKERHETTTDGTTYSGNGDFSRNTGTSEQYPIVERRVIHSGEIMQLPMANEENGFNGFASSSKVFQGPWDVHYDWHELEPTRKSSPIPPMEERNPRDQILKPWDEEDHHRLGLQKLIRKQEKEGVDLVKALLESRKKQEKKVEKKVESQYPTRKVYEAVHRVNEPVAARTAVKDEIRVAVVQEEKKPESAPKKRRFRDIY